MKLLGFILTVVFAVSAFAWDHQRPDFPDHDRPRGLNGDWEITGHSCNSGAFPFDQFVVGRDRYDMSFRGPNFSARFLQGYCQRTTEGFYSINGDVISFTVTRSFANCGPADFGTFNYVLGNVRQNLFSVLIGPFGYGGVCPAGDTLRNSFQRIR